MLALDGAGYLLAVEHVDHEQAALVAALEDIFVAVALLTVTVGLVLPGMIAHAAERSRGRPTISPPGRSPTWSGPSRLSAGVTSTPPTPASMWCRSSC